MEARAQASCYGRVKRHFIFPTAELTKQDSSYKLGPTCPTRLGQLAPYIDLVSRAVSRAGDVKERE